MVETMTEIKIKLMPGCERFLPVKAHYDDTDYEHEPLSGNLGFCAYHPQIR